VLGIIQHFECRVGTLSQDTKAHQRRSPIETRAAWSNQRRWTADCQAGYCEDRPLGNPFERG